MTANWKLGEHVEGSALPGPTSSFAVEERSSRKYVPVMVEGLAPANFNALAISYNANADISSVVYALDGTTVATVTLIYDGSNNLTDVVRT